MAALDVFSGPPLKQRGETGLLWFITPIELRRQIIHPALAEPFSRIRINHFVGIQPLDLRGMTGTPDPERGNAKLAPGFEPSDGLANPHDQQVHVLAPPVFAS